MAEDLSAEYRGWHINYIASGYTTTPMVGGWDFGEIDVEMCEIDADMDFASSAAALRARQGGQRNDLDAQISGLDRKNCFQSED